MCHSRKAERTSEFLETLPFGIPRNFKEFRGIPRNLMPIPTEVQKYGTKKSRRNSMDTRLGKHLSMPNPPPPSGNLQCSRTDNLALKSVPWQLWGTFQFCSSSRAKIYTLVPSPLLCWLTPRGTQYQSLTIP